MPTMLIGVMTVTEACDLLHHCLSSEGQVIPGPHFRVELESEGLTIPDAWAVLRGGRINDPPEHDIKTGEWKYKVEGQEPEGKWLVIVFSFKAIDTAFLITIYSIASRRGQ
jgi:hypothetical protein